MKSQNQRLIKTRSWISRFVLLGCISALTACGAGSGDSTSSSATARMMSKKLLLNESDTARNELFTSNTTFTIGGNVGGMMPGDKVTLLNNGADPVVVTADSNGNGRYTFPLPIAENGSYVVTVGAQPTLPAPDGQICSPVTHNFAKSRVTENITGVNFICSTQPFAISVELVGLEPKNKITLQNNGTDTKTKYQDATFMFDYPVARGGSFKVSFVELPFLQDCRIVNGSGSFVTSHKMVVVDCIPPAVRVAQNFNGTNGTEPAANLIQDSAGNLYGTTINGGKNLRGTVFKITPQGELVTLHHFMDNAGPKHPSAELTLGRDGNLYGTSTAGGTHNGGTVFMLKQDGTDLTTLWSFPIPTNPGSGLIETSPGVFYGVAPEGGQFSKGFVYKMTVDPVTKAATLITLHSFNVTDGSQPASKLVQDGNLLYGTTRFGGSGAGTIYSINLSDDNPRFQHIYSFKGTLGGTSSEGADPTAPLAKGPDGHFYGVTAQGGMGGRGTVYRFNTTNKNVQTYTHFAYGDVKGSGPVAGLTLGADNSFYGTTLRGAGVDDGPTIFRFTPTTVGDSGILITLHHFNFGVLPNSGLLMGLDGNYYGVTRGGGSNGLGMVYKFGRQ